MPPVNDLPAGRADKDDRGEGERARASAGASGERVRAVLGDVFAGLIAAVVVLSYCLSYSALLFPGELKSGIPLALWSMLAGSIVTGAIVAAGTSLPPLSSGPDTPGVAMMSVLGGTVAAKLLAWGASVEAAALHVLLAVTLATAFTGLCMLALGATRSSKYIRFVPYPVAAGFIAATGLLMVLGSLKLVLGHSIAFKDLTPAASPADLTKLTITGLVALIFIASQRVTSSSLRVPAIFIASAAVLDLLLWRTRLLGEPAGWYHSALERLTPWLPLQAALAEGTRWSVFAEAVGEILAIAGVMVVSLLVKVSNMEVTRATTADLDREFKVTGLANLGTALAGGVGGSLLTTPSRVLNEAGGSGRIAGVVAALALAGVLLTGVDLLAYVPTPVLSGLLIFLGYSFLVDTLARPSAEKSWAELALVLAIMLVCVRFGYPAGMLVGFVSSCILFVFRYSRIGVVRRHLTRESLSTSFDRAPEETRFLRDQGSAIHVYWLNGYLFFGSSDAIFERIRGTVETQLEVPVRHVVLDFAGVTGVDMSAYRSLMKLTSYCDRRGISIAYAGLSPALRRSLERGRFYGGKTPHQAFPTRNEAVEWCEEQLLAEHASRDAGGEPADFEAWLAQGLGAQDAGAIAAFFERRTIPAGTMLYRQGDAPDTIDLVASGSVAITLDDQDGRKLRVRRMSHRTVVGEMGFFRSAPRAANVEAESDTVLYTLSRSGYQRMQQENPQLAAAFLQFIIRAMADRIDFANREIAALT
jgi:SulP family sulfate permease